MNNNDSFYNSDNITLVLSGLQKRGFSHIFKLEDECVCSKEYNLNIEELDILEIHRFENAAYELRSVLYVIKCDKYNIKGVIVNPTGNYADIFSDISIDKILSNQELKYGYHREQN